VSKVARSLRVIHLLPHWRKKRHIANRRARSQQTPLRRDVVASSTAPIYLRWTVWTPIAPGR